MWNRNQQKFLSFIIFLSEIEHCFVHFSKVSAQLGSAGGGSGKTPWFRMAWDYNHKETIFPKQGMPSSMKTKDGYQASLVHVNNQANGCSVKVTAATDYMTCPMRRFFSKTIVKGYLMLNFPLGWVGSLLRALQWSAAFSHLPLCTPDFPSLASSLWQKRPERWGDPRL